MLQCLALDGSLDGVPRLMRAKLFDDARNTINLARGAYLATDPPDQVCQSEGG